MQSPKPSRKPLQPKHHYSNNCIHPPPPPSTSTLTPKQPPFFTPPVQPDSNKENNYLQPIPLCQPPKGSATTALCREASLGEELSAVRKRLERLRLEKEKTEKVLRERDMRLDSELIDIFQRGQLQKMLEMEVDRLYRLKQLHSHSMRISPIRSLREKEEDKKISVGQQQQYEFDLELQSSSQSALQSPSSSSASSHVPITVN